MMVATDVSQFEGHNAHVFECGSKDVCKFILNTLFSTSRMWPETGVRVVACSSEHA
jgi:hypothetical protein